MDDTNRTYDDILNIRYVKSTLRKHMPVSDRAAQFAPFAALTGHDAAVEETARITQSKIEPDEYLKEELNQKLIILQDTSNTDIEAVFTYFVPDDKKSGGRYETVSGCVKKIKEFEKKVILSDGTMINIDDIISIDSEIFDFININ